MKTMPRLFSCAMAIVLWGGADQLHAASDVTISTSATSGGAFTGTTTRTFEPSAASANVNRDDIQAFLNAGTPVVIETASGQASPGDITVNNSVTKSAGGEATLTFTAARHITLNHGIVLSAGMLSLSAQGTLTVGAALPVRAPGTINAVGGITLQGTGTVLYTLDSTTSQLQTNGAASVTGALIAEFANDFEDDIDGTFTTTVVQASGGVSGTFTGQPDGSRLTLPNDHGSLRVNYTASTVTLDDWQPHLHNLTWDPGTTDAGTEAFSNSGNTRGGRHYFKVTAQATDIGAWRTRLNVSSGEASLYLRKGGLPSAAAFDFKSELTGSDGVMLRADQFNTAEEWFILIDATDGAEWSLVSGRAYVENLGTLGFTDANANNQYDIGEAITPSTSGGAMPPEGIRFWKATVPTGTPAWSLWLSGSTRDIAVRKTQVPFPSTALFDKKQAGQMLLVPTYLGTGTGVYFLSVTAPAGESVTLDSRIQEVTDAAFDSTQTNVSVTGPPYRVYRVQVPIEQIAWDVSTTAVSGNPDLVVRKNNVGAEFDNDAFSEAPGTTTDGVTLVPTGLSDGTWFITVLGTSAYAFTLRNGEPVITTISFTDLKTNDQPLRAGWRYYKLTDLPSQLGTLGWELELAAQVPGTEIALRRNAVPGRWQYRQNGSSTPLDMGFVDHSGTGGFLQRPGHQADIWYVGIHLPQQALGAFQLDVHPITPTTVAFNNGALAVSGQEVNRFRFFRVDVPAGVNGWDVRVRDVSAGLPQLVVRRDVLPESVGTSGFNTPTPAENTTWPSGASWAGAVDWTGRSQNPGGGAVSAQRLVAGMGRPLESGTYYVGVFNPAGFGAAPAGFTFESRGIGTGQAFPITTLAFAGGNSAVSGLAAREAQFFKVTIPANTPSWELTLAPSSGEMLLAARRGTIPDFFAAQGGATDASGGSLEVEMQKTGPERFTLLAPDGSNFITEGDYFLAVVSEGQNPSVDTVGTGTASGTLTSLGTLAVTSLGTISETPVTQNVAPLEAGRVKAFQFTVPANSPSVEVKLTNRVGHPWLYLHHGTRLPQSQHSGGTSYGIEGGDSISGGWAHDDDIVTIANPPAGTFTVTVRAESQFGEPEDASATLEVRVVPPQVLAFNGGTAAVTAHTPDTWKYFRVDVPSTAGVMGWDVRVSSVTAGSPKMVVRRDLLPAALTTDFTSGPHTNDSWPSGKHWEGGGDWTGYAQDPALSPVTGPRLVAGMGRPLEPGTYYIGVFNDSGFAPADAAYTLESRGIGAGQLIAVNDIASFNGGTGTATALPAREAAYFKITVPANTPSWEVSLAPTVGEMLLIVRRGTIPDFFSWQEDDAGAVPGGGREIEMQKTGAERYTMMPPSGETFVTAGDYYFALVSEGVDPGGNIIGTGTSSGTVTSHGALTVTALGEVSLAETSQAVSLVGGQVKAFSFSVPAGAYALEARLDGVTGGPRFYLHRSTLLPRSWSGLTHGYGVEAGTGDADWVQGSGFAPLTLSSPTAGQYRLTVRAETGLGGGIPDATATLVLRLLPPPGVPVLAFNGGTSAETNHASNTWRYFQVTVPAGVTGWDIRVRDVASGTPQITVRRDELPTAQGTSFGGHPENSDTWPTGEQWSGTVDWSGYISDPGGAQVSGRRLVAGMGRPLEPGTYFVGVFNSSLTPAAYTIESRGIGSGQILPVTTLGFNGGSTTVSSLVPREAAYFKVTISANTPSWEFTLDPSLGEMRVALRRGTVPDFAAGTDEAGTVGGSRETLIAKGGAERYVMLPQNGEAFLTEGDYFLAVVSEGQNPAMMEIGTGVTTGVLQSLGTLAVTNLGSAGGAGISVPLALVSGQVKAFEFTVPAGLDIMELRLDNRTGNPGLFARPGSALPAASDYGSEGGVAFGGVSTDTALTLFSPTTGAWRLITRAGGSILTYPDAAADLVIRPKVPLPLNFSSTQNGNGFSHTDTRQLADDAHEIYSVAVPATVSGQPVLAWKLTVNHTQGDTTLRITKDLSQSGITITDNIAIISPPFFTPGDTWFVDVVADGLTNYTLTSAPVTLTQDAWAMPTAHNQTFGDSGAGLSGDQGTDIGQDDWHFYAVDIPPGNSGLLRTELQAINGNPDLYIREDGIPATQHGATGQPVGWAPLLNRSLSGMTSEQGNWVPLNGRTATALPAGRWYLGVRATGGSNARYRLLASTGQVQDLSLTSGITNHSLVSGDWRYYRFTVPDPAPANWTLTFTQQLGDVVMWLRDTIPPGQTSNGGTFGTGIGWATDAKNQGPYDSGNDPPAAYTFTTPPLRPGSTYYAGFHAKNDATFSLTSATSGGNVAADATLDFYNGTFNGNVPGNSSVILRVSVPPEAVQWKHTSTHSGDVQVRLEQGSIPTLSGDVHHASSTIDSSFTQMLSPAGQWPWRAGLTYFVRLVNSNAAPEAVTFNLRGANAVTLDDDSDGLPDAWETLYFGGINGHDADDDSDGDGLPHLMEFAFNLHPLVSALTTLTAGTGTSGLPLITKVTPGGSPRLRVEYIRRTTATAPRLSYTVEFGSTLTDWQSAGGTATITPIDADWERVVIEDTEAPGGSQRRFGHVVVTATP